MKRVLITGMSGSGKSSVIQELVARGYQAYDLDAPEWSKWIDTDPSDMLRRQLKEKTGFGERIVSARSCPNREMGCCSLAAVPKTWSNFSR
jgi:adenylate kinase family enzyme